jgi:DnaK suppressor protein
VTITDAKDLLQLERDRVRQQIAALSRLFDEIVEGAELVATDDEHDPEGHTIAFERQQAASLLREARLRLADLDDALQRLDRGVYGRCETCRGPIGAERLAAVPGARECIDCASQSDRQP